MRQYGVQVHVSPDKECYPPASAIEEAQQRLRNDGSARASRVVLVTRTADGNIGHQCQYWTKSLCGPTQLFDLTI